ncbi:MAG: hypothetical protein ACJA1R_001129 [Flavobacteriales bacterium]|jgi:hypothetical protein
MLRTSALCRLLSFLALRDTRALGLACATVSALALAACSDDPAADTQGDTDAAALTDVADTSDVGLEPAPEGVTALFDWSAGEWSDARFFDAPWPLDLRRDADGTIAISGIPNGNDLALYQGLIDTAAEMTGFSSLPVAWFRFDAPVSAPNPDEVIAASPESNVLLVNIDPDSPRRGALLPMAARLLEEDDYTPENVLALSAFPGFVLEPSTTYAFVVRRGWGDANGDLLGVPGDFWQLVNASVPSGGEALAELYAPMWETLLTLEVPANDVAVATVFTTTDVVTELYDLTETVRAEYQPRVENLAVVEGRGAGWETFCELRGTFRVPEFQAGEPPYDSDGLLVFDEAGELVQQRETEIPVVIALPNIEMPEAGFPLAMYFHGSGGYADQLVMRGPILEAGGDETPGEGPSFVLAQHGIASAGSSHPVSPERLPAPGSGFDYLNFNNLKVFRDTFRQGVIEQRLYIDALLALELTPEDIAACTGVTLPAGSDSFRFDESQIVAQGQSMGGMYTNMVGAVEPRIRAVVPTGAGGYWSYFILETGLIPGVRSLVGLLLDTRVELSYMHPILHTLQTAWEPAEPMVYMPRLARNPLPGHPIRPIYEPVGEFDEFFPTQVYDAVVMSYRHPQAGAQIWDRMQETLSLVGLDGVVGYPVSGNLTTLDGQSQYTGVVVQYEGDGIADPHGIYAQLEEVKHQYGCFFATFLRDGVATVPAPASLDTACP